jgi:regulator of replication initiation timing
LDEIIIKFKFAKGKKLSILNRNKNQNPTNLNSNMHLENHSLRDSFSEVDTSLKRKKDMHIEEKSKSKPNLTIL